MRKKLSHKTAKSGESQSSLVHTEAVCTSEHHPNIATNMMVFELFGHLCKLVLLEGEDSDLVTIESEIGARQYRYVNDEIVHFSLDGKWFALCKDDEGEMQPNDRESQSTSEHNSLHNLTERELQIVQLVCHGLLTKQIAAKLLISEFTVNTYIKAIFNKLGVRSRAAMVYKFTELSK